MTFPYIMNVNVLWMEKTTEFKGSKFDSNDGSFHAPMF